MSSEVCPEKRRRPAFLLYAADLVGEEEYITASLEERGLFLSLLSRCWIDGSAPSDLEKLAKLIAIQRSDIELAYGPLIKKHFKPILEGPGRLHYPEASRQRIEEAAYRARLSEAGKRGGTKTQETARSLRAAQSNDTAKASSTDSGQASRLDEGPEKKRTEITRRKEVFQGGVDPHKAWKDDCFGPDRLDGEESA